MDDIFNLIRKLGINATYIGYYYLSFALHMVVEDENRLLLISKTVYLDIADHFHTTPNCVERNLRTVITNCWYRGNRTLLYEIAGCKLNKKPTNAEFIDIVSCYIKQECKEGRMHVTFPGNIFTYYERNGGKVTKSPAARSGKSSCIAVSAEKCPPVHQS